MLSFLKRRKSSNQAIGYLGALERIANSSYEQPSVMHVPTMAQMAIFFANPRIGEVDSSLETNNAHLEFSLFGFVQMLKLKGIGDSTAWEKEMSFRYIDACAWASEQSGTVSPEKFDEVFRNRLDLYFNVHSNSPQAGDERDIDLLVGLIHSAQKFREIRVYGDYDSAIRLDVDFFRDSELKLYLTTFYGRMAKEIQSKIWPTLLPMLS